jgi:uncharacterized FlgJ-related protein
MKDEAAVLDVRNLEDCKSKQQYETLKEMFQDARNQIAQGRELVIWQTFEDSPPEMLERITSLQRLAEIERYYTP